MNRNLKLSKTLSASEKISSIISALSSAKSITPTVMLKKKLILKVKKNHKILNNLGTKKVRAYFFNKLNYFPQRKGVANNRLIRNTYKYLSLTKKPLQTRLLS